MKQQQKEKILIIKLGAFGDFLLALSCMKAIRKAHPKAEITLLTGRTYSVLGKQSGFVDHIWVDSKPRWHDFMKLAQMRRKLLDFDHIYDLQNNDRTAFYFRLSWQNPFIYKGKSPFFIGTARGSDIKIKDRRKEPVHAYERHCQLMRACGLEIADLPDVGFMTANIDRLKAELTDKYVLLMIGCAPSRPAKKWSKENFAQLAEFLSSQYHVTPVLIGAEAELDDANWIAGQCPDAVNLVCKTSFYELAELARHAYFAIGNDTGPTHLAALAGCPTLTVFSLKESCPERSKPIGKHTYELAVDDLQNLSPENVMNEVRRVFGS